MPTYSITVERRIVSTTIIEIEAEDEETADAMAEKQAAELPEGDWEYESDDYEVIETLLIEEEDEEE
jgi:GTPase Era involved in 16S rRNA processing